MSSTDDRGSPADRRRHVLASLELAEELRLFLTRRLRALDPAVTTERDSQKITTQVTTANRAVVPLLAELRQLDKQARHAVEDLSREQMFELLAHWFASLPTRQEQDRALDELRTHLRDD